VVVVAGALLQACQNLLERGIHPTTISEGYQLALTKALTILNSQSIQMTLENRSQLIGCVSTSLSSKVVSSSREVLAPLAVDAVMGIIDPKVDTNVDLRDIWITKKKGGTIEDSCIIKNGLVLPTNRPRRKAGGPMKMRDAKIAVIQFCLSSPKTDIENTVTVRSH
jgi:T-complex protein 1 subunit delta